MNKKKIIEAAKRMIRNKRLIQKYSRGEITKEELKNHGIKLSMPIN